jgi:hypothetical protein
VPPVSRSFMLAGCLFVFWRQHTSELADFLPEDGLGHVHGHDFHAALKPALLVFHD